MILPSKHLRLRQSLLGCGAYIVSYLRRPRTVSGLWDDIRSAGHIASFNKFVQTLDMLFLIGVIERDKEKIRIKGGGQIDSKNRRQ